MFSRLFKRGICYLLPVALLFSAADDLEIADNNAKYKAVFIKNFTKYIEWPPNRMTGTFVIGVLGTYPTLTKELIAMSQDKKVGDQSITVTVYKSPEEVANCHLLYIVGDQSDKLKVVLDKTIKHNTLVITDKPGCAKLGAAINFVIVNNRLKFELSNSNIAKSSLKIDSKLLALADVID